MKTLSAILVCLMLIIGGCKTGGSSSGGGGGGGGADLSIPAAGPEDYTDEDYEWLFKMWEEYNSAYTDADKTGSDDSNLCWAATAANLLAWGGWAADEDDVFNTFNEHFANQPGDVYDALRYYFNNFIPGVSAEMVTVREARSDRLLDFVVSALHDGLHFSFGLRSRRGQRRLWESSLQFADDIDRLDNEFAINHDRRHKALWVNALILFACIFTCVKINQVAFIGKPLFCQRNPNAL